MSRSAHALALFALALVTLAGAGIASAGLFESGNSTLRVRVGPLPAVSVTAFSGSAVSLMDDGLGGHSLSDGASVWSTVGASANTSLFVAVPYIPRAVVTVVNRPGAFTESARSTVFALTGTSRTGFGGMEPLSGQLVLSVLTPSLSSTSLITLPLSPVGAGGTAMATVMTLVSGFTFDVTITGGIFNTAPAQITSITTALISIHTPGGGTSQGNPITITSPDPQDSFTFIGYGATSTVTISAGSNQLASASQAGAVTLIAPLRIQTGVIVGSIPGYVSKTFVFVPEPGTFLQLIAVAGALGFIGLRRRR